MLYGIFNRSSSLPVGQAQRFGDIVTGGKKLKFQIILLF